MRLGKRIKNGILFALIAGLYSFMNALPLALARSLGAGLGRLFFYVVPYERGKTLGQLALAFPGKSESGRFRLGRETFAHLGRAAVEFFRFARLSSAQLDGWIGEVRGFENLEGPFKAGRGVVAVTGHVGHWELLAAYTAARTRVSVVARQLYDGRLDDALTAMREAKGVAVFGRNTAVRPIMKWLKDGGVLGVLADQDTGVDSLYVPYFGREAKTPSGAAWLAAATGAALVTAWSRRRPDGKYDLEFQPEIPVDPQGRKDKRLLKPAVEEYTRRLEDFVRESPEQWAWNHSRWRSKKEEASPGWHPSEY